MFDEENLIFQAIFLVSVRPCTFTQIQLAMSQPITRNFKFEIFKFEIF